MLQESHTGVGLQTFKQSFYIIYHLSKQNVVRFKGGAHYNNTDMITIKPAKNTKTKTHLLIKTSESLILLK